MNFFLILIPQSLNSEFLNLAPYSHYDEDGIQKSDIALRSNNEVCHNYYLRKGREEFNTSISKIILVLTLCIREGVEYV